MLYLHLVISYLKRIDVLDWLENFGLNFQRRMFRKQAAISANMELVNLGKRNLTVIRNLI